jgi:3'(2'), 5'-bisphosphate nucleotidase
MDHEQQKALGVAVQLARRAGEVILRYFRTDLEVQRKTEDEPVTRADHEAQAVIIEGLFQHFPDYGVLAEEKADQLSWSQFRRSWVIDPLDGTKDFIAVREGFSVMIGLLEDFQPILGVIYQPVTGLTFQAMRGEGSVMVRDGQEMRLCTATEDRVAHLRLVASKSHRTPIIDDLKQSLGITDEQNVGSVGLKISLIARAERDLYLNPQGHSKLWDACAPEIILAEAGGRMTDLYGDPIRYDPQEIRLNRGIVASNGRSHQAVLSAIAPFFPPPGPGESNTTTH